MPPTGRWITDESTIRQIRLIQHFAQRTYLDNLWPCWVIASNECIIEKSSLGAQIFGFLVSLGLSHSFIWNELNWLDIASWWWKLQAAWVSLYSYCSPHHGETCRTNAPRTVIILAICLWKEGVRLNFMKIINHAFFVEVYSKLWNIVFISSRKFVSTLTHLFKITVIFTREETGSMPCSEIGIMIVATNFLHAFP